MPENDNPLIRPAMARDAEAIARIYNHYIAETIITFEEAPVSTEEMAARIAEVASIPLPWLVAEGNGAILGYAYAGKWKSRCAYRYTVESTVYLDSASTGRGAGTLLYEALIASLRESGIHVVIGGVALPNAASVALHEKLGFRKVAHFDEVGYKFERWIDVGYWQKTLG